MINARRDLLTVFLFLCIFILPEGISNAFPLPLQDLKAQFHGTGAEGPIVSEPVVPGTSADVSALPVSEMQRSIMAIKEINPRNAGSPGTFTTQGLERIKDPLIQEKFRTEGAIRTPDLLLNFEGLGYTRGVPLDPVGAAGPKHYVQMVNSVFAVYDKNGSKLAGPTSINQLWAGAGTACETRNDGDPVVLYDSLADRWLLSQFAIPDPNKPPWYMCIAVSRTSNPADSYYTYTFTITDAMPDYPKLAVWPDAYYMATNDGLPNVGAYAFDRARMLNGQPVTFQKFIGQGNLMMPGNFEGPQPPAGSPNYFYTMMDDQFWPANGFPGLPRLEIWEFRADFNNPANSSFARAATVQISPFNYTVCGYFNMNCIPQPRPGVKLDPVSEWPMWRLQYRNFITYESLVGNFTVDTGSNHAGIRWFELRRSSNSSWSLYQEGTHAPDSNHRWMGSIAMDGSGNIALGYSISSSTVKPGIMYAARLSTDPPGTLQGEVPLASNGGVFTAANRWGDYSSMNVDPSDDCTFWFTAMYINNASGLPGTRVGSFRIPECTGGNAQCTYAISPASAAVPSAGGTGSISVTASSNTCTWTVTNNLSWVTITSGSSGTGDGTVSYSVSANTGADSRTGNITVAGQTFTITESPAQQVQYRLKVRLTGSGTGTVTSLPEGINCGSNCSASYAAGTVVTLSAMPAQGSIFRGWAGPCSGTGACNVTMDADKKATAAFRKK